MIRRVPTLLALLLSTILAATGCRPTQPLYFLDDGDLSHFVDKELDIEYPDAHTTTLDEVEGATPPLTLDNPTPQQIWELKLCEVVQITLTNSKVMRSLGGRFSSSAFNPRAQVGESPDAVLLGPDRIPSVYDPAITETLPGLGVAWAEAQFDPTLSSSLAWQKNDRPQNVKATGAFGAFFTPVFQQDLGTFNTQLTKQTAGGTAFSLRENVTYDANNNPTRQVFSDWNVNYELGFSQPLLQGAGAQFNRIHGPYNPFSGVGSESTFNGIMLARINTDISLADFEAGVRNLVSDAENAYWELSFAYRALEATKTGRTSALQTWKKIHTLMTTGSRGGEADKEAQAREQYFLFRGQVQTSLNDLYRAENRLRYVMGLAVSDGRLIRPADEPTTARVSFDWHEIHSEGLARSIELRRQKWRLKERELELIAARNLLLPRLDASGTYRFMGLGDDLIASERGATTGGLPGTNAYGVLTSGQFQEWNFGLNFQMPLGFRKELSTVRHFQLQLAKERAKLQDQELEVSHEVGDALRNIDFNYELTQTNFNRRIAAKHQVDAVEEAYKIGTVTFDLLLEAQRRLADAEVAYYRSLIDYNRGIMMVHYRKGSLLEYDGVYLSEGPWPAKAQFDAHRLAHQRDASFYMDYGYTRPQVVSKGPYQQHANDGMESATEGMEIGSPAVGVPHKADTEEVPAPMPNPKPTPTRKPAPRINTDNEATASLPSGPILPESKSRGDRPATRQAAGTKSNKRTASVKFRQTEEQPEKAAEPAPDENVQQVRYDEWKASTPREARPDRTASADDRSAAGWKGTKR